MFSVYILIGEGLPSEVEERVTHFVRTCNEKASVDVAQSVTYGNLHGTAIALVLRVRGGLHHNALTKNTKCHCQ